MEKWNKFQELQTLKEQTQPVGEQEELEEILGLSKKEKLIKFLKMTIIT